MWPYWLGAALIPVAEGLSAFGNTLAKVGIPVPQLRISESSGTIVSTAFSFPEYIMKKTLLAPFAITSSLNSGVTAVGRLIMFRVLPLMAMYGIYKKYYSMQNQQQELVTVQEMLEVLNSFGQV